MMWTMLYKSPIPQPRCAAGARQCPPHHSVNGADRGFSSMTDLVTPKAAYLPETALRASVLDLGRKPKTPQNDDQKAVEERRNFPPWAQV